MATTIATYAGFLGLWVDQYEPIAWAEELIEPARAVGHPRLAFVYVMASLCWMAGRIEASVRHSEAGQTVMHSGLDEVPYGIEGFAWRRDSGQSPPRTVGRVVPRPTRTRARHPRVHEGSHGPVTGASPVRHDEAMAAAKGLIDTAEATRNPVAISFALLAYGFAFRDADPDRAREALHRGLAIAQDSGNRDTEIASGGHPGPSRSKLRRPAGGARVLRCGDPQLPRRG